MNTKSATDMIKEKTILSAEELRQKDRSEELGSLRDIANFLEELLDESREREVNFPRSYESRQDFIEDTNTYLNKVHEQIIAIRKQIK